MFYTKKMSEELRLGDVISGFMLIQPKIFNPKSNLTDSLKKNDFDFSLQIKQSKLLVVLTPCCSIGPKNVCFSPLEQINSVYFKNDYFYEDFTRINRPMRQIDSIPKDIFDEYSELEQKIIIQSEPTYAVFDYFFYKPSEFFPKYTNRRRETQYYCINFKKTFFVECDDIKENGIVKSSVYDTKILELSDEIREELRQKIAFYFTRI